VGENLMAFSDEGVRKGRNVLDGRLRKQFLKGNGVRTVVEDDNVAMVNEEGPGSGEVTKLQVCEGVIIKFILSRRLSVNRGDL
jgi:hypothetical protein